MHITGYIQIPLLKRGEGSNSTNVRKPIVKDTLPDIRGW